MDVNCSQSLSIGVFGIVQLYFANGSKNAQKLHDKKNPDHHARVLNLASTTIFSVQPTLIVFFIFPC